MLNADQTGITLSGTTCEAWKSTGGTLTGSFPCEVTFDPVTAAGTADLMRPRRRSRPFDPRWL